MVYCVPNPILNAVFLPVSCLFTMTRTIQSSVNELSWVNLSKRGGIDGVFPGLAEHSGNLCYYNWFW